LDGVTEKSNGVGVRALVSGLATTPAHLFLEIRDRLCLVDTRGREAY
jgi:hypothetical protein